MRAINNMLLLDTMCQIFFTPPPKLSKLPHSESFAKNGSKETEKKSGNHDLEWTRVKPPHMRLASLCSWSGRGTMSPRSSSHHQVQPSWFTPPPQRSHEVSTLSRQRVVFWPSKSVPSLPCVPYHYISPLWALEVSCIFPHHLYRVVFGPCKSVLSLLPCMTCMRLRCIFFSFF